MSTRAAAVSSARATAAITGPGARTHLATLTSSPSTRRTSARLATHRDAVVTVAATRRADARRVEVQDVCAARRVGSTEPIVAVAARVAEAAAIRGDIAAAHKVNHKRDVGLQQMV